MIRFANLTRSLLAAASLPLSASAVAIAESNVSDLSKQEDPVHSALSEFISAVEASDLKRLEASLADEVTFFFPRASFPLRRLEGKNAVVGEYKRLFDILRARGIAPKIVARDIRVQRHGEIAVASLHIDIGAEAVGRRTVVLQNRDGRWRIIHLHASDQPLANPQ